MTRLTQILLAIIAALMITVYIQGRVITSQRRTIEHQRRSIEHGADIAKARLEMSEVFARHLEEERRRSIEAIAKINELKALLHAPRPTRHQPRTREQLRDSFHRALDAR